MIIINKKKVIVFCFALLFLLTVFIYGYEMNVSADSDEYNPNEIIIFNTNVNNPVAINNLISEVGMHVYDNGNPEDIVDYVTLFDGEDYYAYVLNQPNAMSRKLGNYDVVFRCSDGSGNYVNCTITVVVSDTTAPVIDADNSNLALVFKKSEINENTMNIIKNGIKATDNHDTELTKQFGQTAFDLMNAIGTFTVPFEVIDKSGNIATINLDIEIVDEIGPRFSATTTYARFESGSRAKTFSELNAIFGLTAYDFETQTNCAVSVLQDEYTDNWNIPGVYKYTVKATDTNNNTLTCICYIEVIDNIAPTVYIDKSKVTVRAKVLFTIDDAKNIVRARKLVKNDNFELTVEEDEYTENYENIGCYKYLVKATYDDGTNSIIQLLLEVKDEIKEVIDEVITKPVQTKVNIFKASWSFIKRVGSFAWNIIKWPVSKIVSFAKRLFK